MSHALRNEDGLSKAFVAMKDWLNNGPSSKTRETNDEQKAEALEEHSADSPLPLTCDLVQQATPGAPQRIRKRSVDSWSVSDWGGNSNQTPAVGCISRSWLECLPDGAVEESDRMACSIQYPETLPYPDEDEVEDGPSRNYQGLTWRKRTMTSDLHIARELSSRQTLGEQIRASRVAAAPSAPKEASEEPEWPNAHCVLRPARPEDFQQIADIINVEIQTPSPQILYSSPVLAAEIKKLFQYCQNHKRPFIVAVPAEDDGLDPARWPKELKNVYEGYAKWKRSQPKESPVVVGFAFITESRLGFLNSPCPGARFSGQVRIAVHPEHRRKLYGSALLDRILSCVCFRRNFLDYEWKCSDAEKAHVYDSHTSNTRQYTQLYIDVFCEGKEDAGLTWRAAMLNKFGFSEVAHRRQSDVTDQGAESKWLDNVLYAFEARSKDEIVDRPPAQYLQPLSNA
ncbi:Acyl-CoA N-acyltransferase [Purpureocillium lavendulum]|uniref:Acyl-CoA N-acyltransferase n=1 Tax=Purpureocillium lavendulum TaxID=1247861 RepID=A0AB34G6X3_9HYPO|nr:Acyl-CoA N-acyltransferase [Purpureocillium lavendulum]